MNNRIAVWSIASLLLFSLFTPFAYAGATDCSDVDKGIFKGAYTDEFGNPMKSPCTIDSFRQIFVVAKNVLDILIGILSAVFVVFTVIGGIKYITSAGVPDRVKEAKDTITNAVIGLVISVLAYVIINLVAGALGGSAAPR